MNDRALRNVAIGLGGRANGYPREIGLRHHGRLRGDGDPRRRAATSRTCASGSGGITVAHVVRRRQAGHRRGPRRGRRDGGAAQGRDQAEPDPDARGPAVPDALRPVREHRARQQLARRRPDRHEARRLRRDRVGLRLRHGDGEVLRHRLPLRRADAERGRARHHGARDQAPRRRRGRPARRAAAQALRAIEAGMANVRRHLGIIARVRHAGRGRGQPAPGRHQRGGRARQAARARGRRVRRRGQRGLRARRRRARPTSPTRSSRRASSRTTFKPLYEDDEPIQDKIEAVAKRVYGAADVYFYPEAEKKLDAVHRRRARPASRSAWPRRTCRCPPTRRC